MLYFAHTVVTSHKSNACSVFAFSVNLLAEEHTDRFFVRSTFHLIYVGKIEFQNSSVYTLVLRWYVE